MKYLKNLLTNKSHIILGICVLIAILLHVRSYSMPPLNSDEASFAYNAYSILKTGKDEYGSVLPLRFTAFGENKLPVTIYTMVPFLAIFGFSEISARLPFILIGILSPILFYVTTRRFSKSEGAGLIAAFLAAVSPWIQIMSRHIHENIIIMVLVFGVIWLLSDISNRFSIKTITSLAVLMGLGLFTYHIGKVLAVFVFMWIMGTIILKKDYRKNLKSSILILLVPIALFMVTEWMQPTTRISNLFLTSTPGFEAAIQQLRAEDPSRLLHNKGVYAVQIAVNQYFSYFSPEFLVRKGDSNIRFGFPGISPITIVEWLAMMIGITFAFVKKLRDRFLYLSLLLVAPISAAISWQEYSLTRSFVMIIPIILFASYGIFSIWESIHHRFAKTIVFVGALFVFSFQVFFSWEFYFNHYFARPETLAAWQAGYKEVGTFIKDHYEDYDRFYITSLKGQPYIFTLFYLQFPPAKYQEQAQLSELDEYGFGQVKGFDKFLFEYQRPDPRESAVVIAEPGEFPEGIDMSRVTKVTINNQEIFWIYEGQRNK